MLMLALPHVQAAQHAANALRRNFCSEPPRKGKLQLRIGHTACLGFLYKGSFRDSISGRLGELSSQEQAQAFKVKPEGRQRYADLTASLDAYDTLRMHLTVILGNQRHWQEPHNVLCCMPLQIRMAEAMAGLEHASILTQKQSPLASCGACVRPLGVLECASGLLVLLINKGKLLRLQCLLQEFAYAAVGHCLWLTMSTKQQGLELLRIELSQM